MTNDMVEMFHHVHHSPKLAPSDYLFHSIKHHLSKKQFHTEDAIIA